MSRIICVSNRVSLPDPKTGEIKAGGLAVGVKAALESQGGGIWFGWNGEIEAGKPRSLAPPRKLQQRGITFLTISLGQAEYDDYYKAMSNSTLWPFMHELDDHIEENTEAYLTYHAVNERFARELVAFIRPDDVIWVHDYHLMPLGACLRRLGVGNRILYFHHIPIPARSFVFSAEVPASLKKQYRELTQSLFAYDQVGFQSLIDLGNLISYKRLQTELPQRFETLTLGNGSRNTYFGAFPISIETEELERKTLAAENCPTVRNIRKQLGGCRLIIGAERLDYTKGLTYRIKGISKLLSLYPEYREHIRYWQIAPLTREDLKEYRETIANTRSIVEKIDNRFGNAHWHPVEYSEKSVPRDDLIGCFRLADVGLVTPLIDGQNLVAKEYIAAQDPDNPGVLVLSKNAGAAEELGELGTILVDPYAPEDIARKLNRALKMPLKERQELHQAALQYLRTNDIRHWAKMFLREPESALSDDAYRATGTRPFIAAAPYR